MTDSPGRISLTAIVLTQDEEANIARCVDCLAPVDDIIIVDSGSTDATLKTAEDVRSDVRMFEHPFKDFGDQRNWALENTAPRHDWILFVDADEFCTEALLAEIRDWIAAPGPCIGAFIAGKNYFLGRWLKHSTMYPSYQLRLLKRGAVRFRKEGHGQKEITNGPLHYLSDGWVHEGFSKGLQQWIARHNVYSSEEGELILQLRAEPLHWRHLISRNPILRRRALKSLAAKLPGRPWTRFLYSYVWRRGFLDGKPGLTYCLLRLAHDIHILAKLDEQRYLREAGRPKGEVQAAAQEGQVRPAEASRSSRFESRAS